MSASGRTKVASDVKFGVGADFIELYLWSKFGDPSSYVSKRRCRHDGDDGDGDGDGVRVLCHKRLRQLRWARALKSIVILLEVSPSTTSTQLPFNSIPSQHPFA